jgi:hypothetical protein
MAGGYTRRWYWGLGDGWINHRCDEKGCEAVREEGGEREKRRNRSSTLCGKLKVACAIIRFSAKDGRKRRKGRRGKGKRKVERHLLLFH